MTLTANPRLRILYAVWGFVECFLFSGIIYGWGSLVFVLKDEGIYANLCDSTISSNITGTTTTTVWSTTAVDVDARKAEIPSGETCEKQDSMLKLAFTIASSITAICSGLTGYAMFKFGTRVTRIVDLLIFLAGCLMIAFVSVDVPWLIFTGLPLVGIGGVPLLITNVQISNLFTSGGSTVVGLLSGACDSSAAVVLVIKIAYENGITRRDSCLLLCGLQVIVLVSTFLFLPKGHIPKIEIADTDKAVKNDVENHDISESFDSKNNTANTNQIESLNADNSGMRHKPTFRSYALSISFILHILWLSILQLRVFVFVSSLNPWLNTILKGEKSQVSYFTNVSLYTMLGGVVTSFLAGIIHDWQKTVFAGRRSETYRLSMPLVLPLSITSLLAVLMSVLVFIPAAEVLYVTFVVLVLYRSFLYSIVIAFICTVFPDEYFNLLIGILLLMVGLFSFLQYALFEWSRRFGSQQVDIFLLVMVCLSFMHPMYQWYRSRQAESYILQQDAQTDKPSDGIFITDNKHHDQPNGYTNIPKQAANGYANCYEDTHL